MARPRSLKVKLVVDLPERSYQILSALSLSEGKSVSEFVGEVLDARTLAWVSLPLFNALESVPAVPAPTSEVVPDEVPATKKGRR